MMLGAMDHNEVRELLADAAVEPGGLERMMAGDTPNAALVAGHLAGCPECTQEMERLRQTVGVIRPAVRAVPPPELRQRTLDYVAAMGRPRGAEAAAGVAAMPAGAIASSQVPVTVVASAGSTPRTSRAPWRTLAAMAAVLVLAVVGTGLVMNARLDAALRTQAAEIDALGDVARWTLRVDAQPDGERVELASTTGAPTTGTLFYSRSSKELVVVADQLAPPPAGHEYRCWVEVNGQRKPMGKMFFGGNLAYWVGDVPEIANVDDGATFGVTLIDLASPGTPGEQVLVGEG
jgi:hypothetical protein